MRGLRHTEVRCLAQGHLTRKPGVYNICVCYTAFTLWIRKWTDVVLQTGCGHCSQESTGVMSMGWMVLWFPEMGWAKIMKPCSLALKSTCGEAHQFNPLSLWLPAADAGTPDGVAPFIYPSLSSFSSWSFSYCSIKKALQFMHLSIRILDKPGKHWLALGSPILFGKNEIFQTWASLILIYPPLRL